MFFVGASAHLFIYLLIPAFFVVCCYFKGTVGSLGDFLSVNVASEQKTIEYSNDTYVYKKEVKKKKSQQIKNVVESSTTDTLFTAYHYTFYSSVPLFNLALRAPPILFF